MVNTLDRVEVIGVLLVQHKKIKRGDIEFLQKYYQTNGMEKLTPDQILTADPLTLTQGQKAYRTAMTRTDFN